MTKEELIEKINDWEASYQEDFTDYFMHDNVKDNSWAFWLIGKGFKERGNVIIDLILKGEKCLDQYLLYRVHSAVVEEDYGTDEHFTREQSAELYEKDVELWAEFLTDIPFYEKKVADFLSKKQ